MGRGSGGSTPGVSMKESMSLERYVEVVDKIRVRTDGWMQKCLVKSFERLVNTLQSGDKIKKNDTNDTLVSRMVSLIDSVCGDYLYYLGQLERIGNILGEVVTERDPMCAAITARYEIQRLRIVIAAMERSLKEKNEECVELKSKL